MPRPRLVATDLDGTLLRSDASLSARTRRALDRVRDSGIEVVVTTGRPPRALDAGLREAVGGVAICANGALLYDLDTGTVVGENTIAPDAALAIVRHLRKQFAELSFAVETASGFGHEPGYLPLLPARGARVADIQELVQEPVAKSWPSTRR